MLYFLDIVNFHFLLTDDKINYSLKIYNFQKQQSTEINSKKWWVSVC